MLNTQIVKDQIAEVAYRVTEIPTQGPRHTTCTIVTVGGSIITGESCCMDEQDFDETLGRDIAYERAFDKLCELEAYRQREEAAKQTDVIEVEGLAKEGVVKKMVKRFKGDK